MRKSDLGGRAGWLLGGTGGLLWIILLGVMFFVQGNFLAGLMAVILFTLGIAYLFRFAPWKHPQRSIGLLYSGLPFVIILAAAIFIMLWDIPDSEQLDFNRYTLLLFLIPGSGALFVPSFTLARKRWQDIHGEESIDRKSSSDEE
jgi:uncharacterized membrane protein YhaH (DUF805 family)